MSESVKPRFAVDLNEIERHLAPAGSHQAQPAAAPRNNDPLAELARIVGQDDPFQAILANDGAARPRPQASAIDDLFASRDTMTPASRQAQSQARPSEFAVPDYDLGTYAHQSEAPRATGQAYAYQQPAPVQQQAAYHEPAYTDEYYDEGADNYAGADYAQPERLNYPPVEKPRSRKGLIAIGAVVGAIVIGGGGAYMLTRSSGSAGGAPILVQATHEPVKVQPQNPGGVEIPNQNKQIYERAQQSTETKVVNREEQPVDVKQAVRSNGGSAVADATGATVPGTAAQARSASNNLNLGEPRKVRTVTIRPDGTVAGAPEAAPSARPAPVAMTMPATASASPTPQPAAAQPRPVATTPVATPAATPAPKPAPAGATPAAATPVATAPAAAAPTPASQKVAAVQTAAAAPAVAASDTGVGGFSAQLGVAASEGAANATFAQLQRKYPDLEGMPSLIRKAEVNGNTVYRVRVGPMSREEASSLCSKLQGQGGQCFVAKN